MSTQDDAELEAAAAIAPEDLSDEIARKWDPERLLQMVAKRAGKGEALDATLRHRYEKRFGIDLGHVRIVTGEFAEEFNRERGANAATIGSTGMILMGGRADKAMGTAAGEALLAHELTHVAQAERSLQFDAAGAPLATEANEAEAEQTEADVHAEQSGAAAHQASGAAQKSEEAAKEMLEHVIHRVMDMFAEAGRVDWMRNGFEPRRP